MNGMTLEQVRELIARLKERRAPHSDVCAVRIKDLDAIESALAPRVVTDDDAGKFHDDLMEREGGSRRWECMGEFQRECWRAALEEFERNRR